MKNKDLELGFQLKPIVPALMISMMVIGCATPQSMMPTVNSDSAKAEARKQQEMVVDDYIKTNEHLQSVSSRILISGKDLCGVNVGPYYGATVWNIDNIKNKTWKEIAQSKYGLGSELQVLSVDHDSPAEKAGIKSGDKILSVNGGAVQPGKDAITQYQKWLETEEKYGVPVELTVRRDGAEQKIPVSPVQACKFRVNLAQDDSKNAYADGKGIFVHKGMMEFIKSDEELALVVSHELAHNSMLHINAKKQNATVGALLGALVDVAAAVGGVNTNGQYSKLASNIGAGVHSVEFEQEADYVGLYFMATAGYKIEGAANFWRRMAVANPNAITMKSDHPTSPERFVAIESAVTEINQKIANGEPLKPAMKPKSASSDVKTKQSPAEKSLFR